MQDDLRHQDQRAREQALDPQRSFIIQAPAGSGKTELLIQRFLTMLSLVKKPEEVLAITFTKKAAHEMRSRVIKALKNAAFASKPESAHAQKTWQLAREVLQKDAQLHWHLLQNPNRLRIQTIDALCAYLTKQLPLLAHFGATPDIIDNPLFIYREAVQEILGHLEEDVAWTPAIRQLLIHLDNDLNKLANLLIDLLANRDQWLAHIYVEQDDKKIKTRLENHLTLIIREHLQKIITLFPQEEVTELISLLQYAMQNTHLLDPASPLHFCNNITQLPGTKPTDKEGWLGIATFLLTKSFSWRKRISQDIGFPTASLTKNAAEKKTWQSYQYRMKLLIERLQDHEALRIALSELYFLPHQQYQKNQWQILQALLQLLKIVTAQLRVQFQGSGKIDYIENAQAALIALGSDEVPTDLALALDYRIQHILIDEFQDTSHSQFRLIEKLTAGWQAGDERSLFIVGDPMQSIYRFREAEVGLFIQAQQGGIGHIALHPLTLAINFRSAPTIVDWINHTFQIIFPLKNDIAQGAVAYSPCIAQITAATSAEVAIVGYLEASPQHQAVAIVEHIAAIKKEHPEERIAILVRARTHLEHIIAACKKKNVCYRAVDIEPLATKQCIQDLLALTCALQHPADRLSWLVVLRAPWCGLSLHDLYILAGENPYSLLLDTIFEPAMISKMSEEGQQRLNRIAPIIKQAITARDERTLRYRIEHTWLLLGGPASLRYESDLENTTTFFNLIEELEQAEGYCHVQKLKEKLNRLFASSTQADDSLQIMTIHSAKGLEFDTVFLPHLERKVPSADKSLLLWMEQPLISGQHGLLLAPLHATGESNDAIYDYINRQLQLKLDYEIDRLLYVAATRAKKKLFLYFNAKKNSQDEISAPATGSFLEKLWPMIKNHSDRIVTPENLPHSLGQAESKYLPRFPLSWQNTYKIAYPENNFIGNPQKKGFLLIDEMPQQIGIIIHRILQNLSRYGLSWWPCDYKQQVFYVQRQLQYIGIWQENLVTATTQIMGAIEKTLQDPRGQWILSTHRDAQAEYPLTMTVGNQIKSIVVDRTFIDEQGIRWIIDYKTASLNNTPLDQFLRREQDKYHAQLMIYYEALQRISPLPTRMGLYYPVFAGWIELVADVVQST